MRREIRFFPWAQVRTSGRTSRPRCRWKQKGLWRTRWQILNLPHNMRPLVPWEARRSRRKWGSSWMVVLICWDDILLTLPTRQRVRRSLGVSIVLPRSGRRESVGICIKKDSWISIGWMYYVFGLALVRRQTWRLRLIRLWPLIFMIPTWFIMAEWGLCRSRWEIPIWNGRLPESIIGDWRLLSGKNGWTWRLVTTWTKRRMPWCLWPYRLLSVSLRYWWIWVSYRIQATNFPFLHKWSSEITCLGWWW